MKYYAAFLILHIVFTAVHAQLTVESGVELTIESGVTLTIEGDFTQSGTLAIIIGPDQHTHSTINVSGTFSIGGTYTVTNDNYTPSSGDHATIVVSGNLAGEFANDEDNSWLANYDLPSFGEFSISHSVSLPVSYTFLKGLLVKEEIHLLWQTASEMNNQGFDIQRSVNARDWRSIGFSPGKGTVAELTDYLFIDEAPSPGLNYYRLKQIDFDGSHDFSETVVVNYYNSDAWISVFPNPSDGRFHLQVDTPSGQPIGIRVFDNLGRVLWENEVDVQQQNWVQEIDINRNGVYFIACQIGNRIFFERIVVSKAR